MYSYCCLQAFLWAEYGKHFNSNGLRAALSESLPASIGVQRCVLDIFVKSQYTHGYTWRVLYNPNDTQNLSAYDTDLLEYCLKIWWARRYIDELPTGNSSALWLKKLPIDVKTCDSKFDDELRNLYNWLNHENKFCDHTHVHKIQHKKA